MTTIARIVPVAFIVLTLLGCGVAASEEDGDAEPQSTSTDDVRAPPTLVVQYHAWFDTRWGAESVAYPTSAKPDMPWGCWDPRCHGLARSTRPDSFRPDGWRRFGSTSGEAYPLVGMYDPDERELLRWHIRLAKAAGINAFAVSLYNWGGGAAERRLAEIMRSMLDIAAQENFRISWEMWWGGPDLQGFFARYRQLLVHPAFLRVDGRPVVWIATSRAPNDYFGDTPEELDRTLAGIESRLGMQLAWAVNDGVGIDMSRVRRTIISMTNSNLFTAANNWNDAARYGVNRAHEQGRRVGTHVYPGFDEAGMVATDPRYHSRQGGETLRYVLQQSAAHGADFVFLESWNDFGEATAIEPGWKEDLFSGPFARDPYKDLRIVAGSRGVSFVPPALPPAQAIDPAVRDRLSRRVRFRARAAFGAGASGSNGAEFSLTTLYSGHWVTLATRTVRPADGEVDIVADVPEIFGSSSLVVLGVDAAGDSYSDWTHWLSARIEIDGRTAVDLIETAPRAHWHSSRGTITFGTGGPNGTATWAGNVRTTAGNTYGRTLYVHPDYSNQGFSHGGYSGLRIR